MQRIPRRAEGEGKVRGISRRDPIRRCTRNGPVGCKLHRFARQQCTADKLDALRLQHGAVLVLCPLVHRKHTVASVAVVITGTAPHTAASARARSLAPPRWPERMGTAKRPHSSSTTTAGSCALLWQWGAMARTAMPTAPTKTRASLPANWRAVQSARCTCPASWPQRVTLPGYAAASFWASARPFAVKAR